VVQDGYLITGIRMSKDGEVFPLNGGGSFMQELGSYSLVLLPSGKPILPNFKSLNESFKIWLNTGNWWRYGMGPHNGEMVKRLAWGSHPRHLNKVPKLLQPLNQWLRKLGGGHYNF
jgi:hypothetical protein